jgi:DNA-binding transcriptional LysR family regulator
MELQQLRYFQVVAANQHITRSAEQLNISQPAISAVISRLEKELGTQLFERSGRNITLNEAGRIFLERVNHILLEVDNAAKEIAEISNEGDNSIRLSVTSPQFIQGIAGYMEKNQNIKWWQRVEIITEIQKQIECGQIDFGITSPGISSNGVDSVVLLKDEFMVAVHPNHPFAKRKDVSLVEVGRDKLIALQKHFPFRTQSDNLFADFGIVPNIVMECDHYLRREMVGANAGITLSSKSAKFRRLYDPKIVFLPIHDVRRNRDIVLSWPKGKFLSNSKKSFIDFMIFFYHELEEKAEKE